MIKLNISKGVTIGVVFKYFMIAIGLGLILYLFLSVSGFLEYGKYLIQCRLTFPPKTC